MFREFSEKMLKEHKPKLECVVDPRGNFVIEIVGDELIVRHIDPQGIFLQEFRGGTAEEIRNQIARFITDPVHAMYMGAELARAELAMKNKTEYTQG